jgi:hypothetical protein
MDLTNEAAAGGSEAISIAVAPAPAGETPLGVREAARNLVNWRQSREKLQRRVASSGEGGDRDAPPPAPEQEATDATAVGEREAPSMSLPTRRTTRSLFPSSRRQAGASRTKSCSRACRVPPRNAGGARALARGRGGPAAQGARGRPGLDGPGAAEVRGDAAATAGRASATAVE